METHPALANKKSASSAPVMLDFFAAISEENVARTEFAMALERRIKQAYRHSPHRHGWRLLYSPEDVLDGSKVAFIGLNPGGSFESPDHAEFAMPKGSAYVDEVWPSSSRLQQEALALFERLGIAPEAVLAGNLVPFRSPDWKSLAERRKAQAFGEEIWGAILDRACPRCVVTFGSVANDAVRVLLGVSNPKFIPVRWGDMTAQRGEFERTASHGTWSGTWIGMPHLSRFTVMTRPASRAAIDVLFEGL
ncbi:uracil-DNA glycosylase family protein [Antarctobacter heliothermus]|uniref:uracil-DNA glycosylase family protein n=1 Tax=Antarctobacter heliothermus TaxID=74033 RepID=UPI001483C00F|nr:uracil-DNA glycosylase family protein [Antarctobacter heliothermus]